MFVKMLLSNSTDICVIFTIMIEDPLSFGSSSEADLKTRKRQVLKSH